MCYDAIERHHTVAFWAKGSHLSQFMSQIRIEMGGYRASGRPSALGCGPKHSEPSHLRHLYLNKVVGYDC